MIGRALRMDIEKYAGRREEKLLFAVTKAGTLTADMVSRYLASLHYMLTLTPLHMARARDAARALGDEPLAQHFQHKLEEEVGHDAWAENDLRALESKKQSAAKSEVMPSAFALGRHIEAAIDEHPALYLAYIGFAEYITVVVGPEWLALLAERCNIPRTSMTVVDYHVELDREHAEEGFSVMDDLIGDPKLLPRMREMMEQSAALFDAYCNEAVEGIMCAEHAPHESGPRLVVDVKHVSAA